MEGTNLLGKSHKKYVQEQIKIRQEKLGSFSKSSTDISWMNGKTSWVRLASSVNIENSTIRVPLDSKELYKNARYDAGGDSTSSQNISPEINTIIQIGLDQLNSEGLIGTDVVVPTGDNRLKLLGFGDEWKGNNLAKSLVLVGGAESFKIKETDGNPEVNHIKRKGVSPTSFPVYQGKDFGLVAMPGIQSVDIKSKSMGSLREANISIRVNDASQLELIETLYLRLGYSMFLEWGNSSYFKNDGEYTSGALVDPNLLIDFLTQSTPSQQDIDRILITRMFDLDGDGVEDKLSDEIIAEFERQIDTVQVFQNKMEEAKESSCGNYDAFFGKVTNFSWEFDPAGFYNVNLTMISWGDIIESLNINSYYSDVTLTLDEEGNPSLTEVDRKNSSALESFIYEATLPAGEQKIDKEGKIFDGEILPTKDTLLADNSSRIYSNWYSSKVENTTASDFSDNLNYDRSQTNSQGKIISCNAIFGGDKFYSYVRFGDLLDFIKYKLLIYNIKTPIIDIETRGNRSFCFNPEINISADPSKVMINRTIPFFDITLQENEKIPPDARKKLLVDSKLQSSLGSFAGQIENDDATISTVIEPFDSIVPGTGVVGGDIMNIYLEKNYLYGEIDNLKDIKTGGLPLYKFLKNILDTIGSCLGGVNKLDLRIKDDRVIEIYDQIPLYGVQKEELPQKFNIYGVTENNGSFVTNFGLKTELTSEFATSVAIGAQSNGSVVGEDSTMLSKFNFGLIDRFIPQKIDSISRDFKEKEKEEKELRALSQKMRSLWIGYKFQFFDRHEGVILGGAFTSDSNSKKLSSLRLPAFETQAYSSFVQLQQNFFKSLIKLESNSHSKDPYRLSNQIGMLPINLNLELDGISGIRIYDQINVDTRFLPSYYPDYLIFIIKGISHKFVGNRWVTNIETIAQPKVGAQKPPRFVDKFTYTPSEEKSPTEREFSPNQVPNATDLRTVLDELGYLEKGEEIANGGDITFDMRVASEAVFRYLKITYPNIGVVVTGGNDTYHQNLNAKYVSLHTTGNALDFVISPPTEENLKKTLKVLQEFTAGDILQQFSFIDEYADPSKAASGKHFHMVIGGGPSAKSARATANALADEGKITRRSSTESFIQQGALDELNRPF